jgi:penicillin-binding protein 1C
MKLRHMRVFWWIGAILLWLIVVIVWVGSSVPYSFGIPDSPVRYASDWSVLVWEKYIPWNDYDDIPPALIELVVSIEDKYFWSHHGVDGRGLVRAAWITMTSNSIQWWSTITQQLVKLDRGQFERSIPIKIQEIWHAIRIEYQLPKEQILLNYLNLMPRPWNVKWWNAACQYFMWRSCELLSKNELMVLMIASQRGWNLYDLEDQKRILTRLQSICSSISMVSCDTITGSIFDGLEWSDTSLDPRVQSMIIQEYATEQTDYTIQIATSIDRILDRTAQYREQYQANNCCVVVLNGEWNMVSMNQCSDWGDEWWGKTNSCLVPRQTWSVTKPLLYAYGMQRLWLQRDETVVDEYTAYSLWWWALYEPQNFDLKYHGEVSWAYALGNSLNIPAVKMLAMVWVEEYLLFLSDQLRTFASWTKLNTISSNEVWLSLALGTYEITPYQMSKLWQFFTSRWQGYTHGKSEVLTILQDPLKKIASFGQDSFLVHPWWAVKTGTSRNFVDGWICGVQLRQEGYIACMRMGNVTNVPMLGSSSEVWWFIRDQIVQSLEYHQKD